MRKELDALNFDSMMYAMSEGNPGALSVLFQLMQEPTGLMDILHLDDMNIRGTQIWIGYKYWADQDIAKFREGIKSRNPELVAKINELNAEQGCTDVAVVSGASFA